MNSSSEHTVHLSTCEEMRVSYDIDVLNGYTIRLKEACVKRILYARKDLTPFKTTMPKVPATGSSFNNNKNNGRRELGSAWDGGWVGVGGGEPFY